jgi:hypothetical protein
MFAKKESVFSMSYVRQAGCKGKEKWISPSHLDVAGTGGKVHPYV